MCLKEERICIYYLVEKTNVEIVQKRMKGYMIYRA